MQVLILVAHPSKDSFNYAIAETCNGTCKKSGHTTVFHDLYREDFDPILHSAEIPRDAELPAQIKEHCEDLVEADGIIVVHPNWWGQPPALLKGWLDRILRPDIAYRFEENDLGDGIGLGLLKTRFAMVFNTANTSEQREKEVFGDPLERLWRNCVFDFCGVTRFYRKMFRIMVTSTPEQRNAWLREVEETVNRFLEMT